jgi:hypothetical protein
VKLRSLAQLPADEMDAEFNQADFTGRALASIQRPLHATQPLAGQLSRSPGRPGKGGGEGGGGISPALAYAD